MVGCFSLLRRCHVLCSARRLVSCRLCELRHESPRMLCDVLVRGGSSMVLVLLILCMPIVQSVYPFCFGALVTVGTRLFCQRPELFPKDTTRPQMLQHRRGNRQLLRPNHCSWPHKVKDVEPIAMHAGD